MAGNPGWNVNTPDTLGLEWMAAQSGTRTIDAPAKAVGWTFGSTAAETIDQLETYSSSVSGAPRMLFEVFTAGSEECGAETTAVFNPNAVDENQSSSWEDQNNSSVAADLITSLTDGSESTYVKYTGTAVLQGRLVLEFATAAWAAARRVKKIRLIFTADTQTNTMQVQPFVEIGASRYDFGSAVVAGTERQTYEAVLGEFNPATGLPWTQADIVAFDSTSGIGLRPANGKSRKFRVYALSVEIDYVTENRLAVGAVSPTVAGWNAALLAHPTSGADNWAKGGAGNDYTVTLRRIYHLGSATDDTGSVAVPYLDSGDAPPIDMTCSQPFVEGFGCVGSVGDVLTRLYPLVMVTTAPTDSLDSQPYVGGAAGVPAPFGAEVFTGNDAEQEITTPGASTGSYTLARFLVAAPEDGVVEPLLVKVRRRSDNVQFGSTITLTPADVLAAPVVGVIDLTAASPALSPATPLHLLEVEISTAAALANSIQYYAEFSSAAAAGVTTQWWVPYQSTANNGNAATFGGTTDRATVNTAEDDQFDIPVTLSTQPAAIQGFSVSLVTADLPHAEGSDCVPDSVDYVSATWIGSALTDADFGSYDIERTTDAGATWETVASITARGVTEFQDWLAPVTVSSCYRIRQIRAGDDIPSPWSAEDCAVRQGTGGCDWIVTAAEAPTLTVAYTVDGTGSPEVGYVIRNAAKPVYRDLWGRDYAVRASPTEDRGLSGTLDFLLHAGENEPADAGIRRFDALRALADAEVSAWALLDWRGNVFHVGIEVDPARVREVFNRYVAEMDWREIAAAPPVIDVELTGAMILASALVYIDAAEPA